MDESATRSAPSQNRPLRLPADGELAEPPWQNAAVVGAQTRHHHHPRALGRGGNANASGVTGAAAAAWVPESGALGGGDVYARLWHDMAQLEGRVDGDTAAAPWPPARPPGPSTSGRIAGTGAPLKRGRDELDTHGEDADFEAAAADDGTRPASSKRRTRAAEVHNTSERRRRDRINEKMRALQQLVPHCDKTDKASILDETIEYLKSLQSQVQLMWMTTGMAPMMPPGGHQPQFMGMGLDSSCMPPATQVPSQMQSVPPFMNNLLQTQMPGVSPAATSVTDVANQVQKSSVAGSWNPFFHPIDATAATPEVPSLFGYASQMAHQNEIQELLATTAPAPASGAESPSSSDGTGTT